MADTAAAAPWSANWKKLQMTMKQQAATGPRPDDAKMSSEAKPARKSSRSKKKKAKAKRALHEQNQLQQPPQLGGSGTSETTHVLVPTVFVRPTALSGITASSAPPTDAAKAHNGAATKDSTAGSKRKRKQKHQRDPPSTSSTTAAGTGIGEKMEEPPGVGASKKHRLPTRSASTPDTSRLALRAAPAAAAATEAALAAAAAASAAAGRVDLDEDDDGDGPPPPATLAPDPAHPDVRNGGLSATARARRYVALDCEMVGVGNGRGRPSIVARASCVNWDGHQLYDSFVQPTTAVTDFRTAVSGVRPSDVAPGSGARPLADVRADVARLLAGRVLVGHSVQNDLRVLRLAHPSRDVRDMTCYPAYRAVAGNTTPALRRLAKDVLGLDIQSGSHCSVEDARVTMALFRREKDGFEREALKRFGRLLNQGRAQEVAGESDGEDRPRKPKKPAKKKSKTKKKKQH